MVARFKLCVGVLVGAAVVASGGLVHAQGVVVDPTSYDFMVVKVGDTASTTVDVNHNSGGPVEVQSVAVDDPTNFSVSEDETWPVDVDNSAKTSTSFTASCTPQMAGVITTATVTVTTDGADPTMTLDCEGAYPDIVVPAGTISFNTISYDDVETDEQTLTITNDGIVPLTISDISATGDFTVISPTSFPLDVAADGGTLDIDIEFAATATGTRTGTLSIDSDDPDSGTVTRDLTGDATPHLRVEPLTINFDDIPEGTDGTPETISICNDGSRQIALVSPGGGVPAIDLDDSNGNFTGGTVPTGPINGGNCVTYDVTFTPQDDGSFTGSVTISTDATGVTAYTVDLNGTAQQVASSYTPSPEADFGDVDINGGTAMIDIDWTNDGNATLNVREVRICEEQSTSECTDSVIFTASVTQGLPTNIGGGNKVDIAVTVNPETVGTATHYLRTAYRRGASQPNEYLFLPLVVNGTSAQVSLGMKTAIDFLSHDVDLAPKIETIVVQNTGDADLGINDISISGDDNNVFSLVSPSEAPWPSIASGDSLTVEVSYAPTEASAGEPTAFLEIDTELSGTPDIQIPINGQGIDRRIAVSTTIQFPDTFRSPAEATIVPIDIENLGRAPLNIDSVVIENDDAGVFSVRPVAFSAVGGLSTETIEIEFRPTMLRDGGYSGEVVINNDDDNDPMARIDIAGLAILPMIEVDPGTLDYGQIGVGVTSEVGLEVPLVKIVNLDPDRSFQLRELRVVDLAGQPIDENLFRIRGLENPREVAAGGDIDLEIEFNPSVEGEFQFILQVFAEADPLPITTSMIRAEAVDVKLRGGGCNAGGGGGLSAALLLLLLGALMRKKPWRRLALTAGLVGALMTPAAASAQSTRNLELGNFRPTIGNEADFITVDNTRVGSHLAWAAGVGFGFASDPLIVESEETDMIDEPVQSRLSTDIWASFAFLERFEVGANIKLLQQSGEDPMFSSIQPADGFAVGDTHLYAKMHLLDARPLSVAAAGFFSIPTATDQEFAGAEGFSGGARGIAAVDLGRIRLGANLGYRLRQNGRLADVVQGDEIGYGIGGSFLIAEDLQAIAEVIGAIGIEGDETGGISPLEGVVGLRYHIRPQWGLIAGAGRGLVSGIGAPAVRGFLMLTVSPGRTARKVLHKEVIMVSSVDPNADDDGDGMLNKDDECPRQAEDVDGFQDEDGCADLDNDGDGLMDKIDRCKDVPEDKDGYLDDDGCPEEDNDGDGIKDVDDKCPDVPEDKDGFKDDDGCDDFDNDRDGVPDLMDMCPKKKESINGNKDEDGCPDKGASAVMVLNKKISVMEPISFWGKSTKLKKRSANVIGQVAATLRANPEFARVAIEVHVHPRSDKDDQKLSEDRAKVIKEQMSKRGVSPKRLVIQAKGSSNPVRKKGRNAAKFNDRVVFPVLEVKEVP